MSDYPTILYAALATCGKSIYQQTSMIRKGARNTAAPIFVSELQERRMS